MTTDIGPQDIEMVDAEVIEDSIPIASDLPMARAEEPIFSLAWDCDDLIQECLKRTDTDSVPTQDTWREYERRFNAWWEHHGVFAKSIANLDRKLHRRPEIRDIVVRLLIILKRNLILAKECLTSEVAEFVSLPEETDAHLAKSLMQISVEAIDESLMELSQVGIVIRQSTKSTETERARWFGFERVHLDAFEALSISALEILYPNASDCLLGRLARTMVDRYARILYREPRQEIDVRQQSAQPQNPAPALAPALTSHREHYYRDLEPFCCILEDCAGTIPSFASIKSWREHMSRHDWLWPQHINDQRMWRCKIDSMHESDAMFSIPDLMCGHVRLLHPDIWHSLDDKSLTALVERGFVDIIDKPNRANTCPICFLVPKGMESLDSSNEKAEVIPKLMEDHVSQHLQKVMVLSLRLMETQNNALDCDLEGGSLTPDDDSLICDFQEDSDADDLPSPPLESPTFRPSSPNSTGGESMETEAADWADVHEARQEHENHNGDNDPIIDHFRLDADARSRRGEDF